MRGFTPEKLRTDVMSVGYGFAFLSILIKVSNDQVTQVMLSNDFWSSNGWYPVAISWQLLFTKTHLEIGYIVQNDKTSNLFLNFKIRSGKAQSYGLMNIGLKINSNIFIVYFITSSKIHSHIT
jgi:hypothetical protein